MISQSDSVFLYCIFILSLGMNSLSATDLTASACTQSLGSCTSSSACDFELTWVYDAANQKIDFTMKAAEDNSKWMAVGFSADKSMVCTCASFLY